MKRKTCNIGRLRHMAVIAFAVIFLCDALIFSGEGVFADTKASGKEKAKAKASAAVKKTVKKSGNRFLKRFKTRKGLKKYIKAVKKKELKKEKAWLKKIRKASSSVLPVEDVVMEGAAVPKASAPGNSASSSAATDHAGTYTQVEGVDEADLIKTDGKYIYNVGEDPDSFDQSVMISSASAGKVKKLSTIDITKGGKLNRYVNDIYVKGDRLIAICTTYYRGDMYDEPYVTSSGSRRGGRPSWKPSVATNLMIYDIKDRKDPKVIHAYSQSGTLVSSRMIGEYAYLVTEDYVRDYKDYFIPCVRKNGKTNRISARSVFAFPGSVSANYAVIGAVDTSAGKSKSLRAKTKAVLGASSDMYVSTRNMYLAKSVYGHYMDMFSWDSDLGVGYSGKTTFLKLGIDKTSISIKARGAVKGVINDQFSMDEHGDYFRVATTGRKNGKDINYLFVMDKKMKVVGKTKPFAEDEHIEAVRFLGDTGYVITYEETDPLFVVDLSKPRAPEITGSVKITGFSTLLHPVGKTKLLGVGYATEASEDIGMEVQDGIKLALFSVKEKNSPKVLDSKVFKNTYSEAQYDHRALLVNDKRGYYAIPYDTDSFKGGVICFRVEGDKLKVVKRWKCKSEIKRCVAIGRYVYASSGSGKLRSFKL